MNPFGLWSTLCGIAIERDERGGGKFTSGHFIFQYNIYFGRVVRDFRVFRYETDTETRLVHGRRTRRVQESGTPEQNGALAAVHRHFGHGQLVGHQTVSRPVYPTAAGSFAVAVQKSNRRVILLI